MMPFPLVPSGQVQVRPPMVLVQVASGDSEQPPLLIKHSLMSTQPHAFFAVAGEAGVARAATDQVQSKAQTWVVVSQLYDSHSSSLVHEAPMTPGAMHFMLVLSQLRKIPQLSLLQSAPRPPWATQVLVVGSHVASEAHGATAPHGLPASANGWHVPLVSCAAIAQPRPGPQSAELVHAPPFFCCGWQVMVVRSQLSPAAHW